MKISLFLTIIAITLVGMSLSAVAVADTPAPLAMTNKTLGGGQLNAYTSGVEGGTGLHNIGLLVKTCGTVTYYDDTNKFFYIDDGSGIKDGTTKADGTEVVGIRVSYKDLASGLTIVRPTSGWVMVTGISSTSQITVEGTTRIIRTLLPRKQSDLQ